MCVYNIRMLYVRLIISGIVLSFSVSMSQSAEYQTWRGIVTRIIDGDTICVKKQGTEIRIRLYGIDCPEKGQKYFQQAKAFVEEAVLGKIIKLEELYHDRYKREVCIIFVDGKIINRELVAAGLARVYPLFCSDPALCAQWRRDEIRARENALGMWSLDPAPDPPWRHRRYAPKYDSTTPHFKMFDTGIYYASVITN